RDRRRTQRARGGEPAGRRRMERRGPGGTARTGRRRPPRPRRRPRLRQRPLQRLLPARRRVPRPGRAGTARPRTALAARPARPRPPADRRPLRRPRPPGGGHGRLPGGVRARRRGGLDPAARHLAAAPPRPAGSAVHAVPAGAVRRTGRDAAAGRRRTAHGAHPGAARAPAGGGGVPRGGRRAPAGRQRPARRPGPGGRRQRLLRLAVLADVSVPALYGGLVAPEHLPPQVLSDLRRFQWDFATFKVDWALDGPVPWQAEGAVGAGTVHLADGVDELTRFAAQLAM